MDFLIRTQAHKNPDRSEQCWQQRHNYQQLAIHIALRLRCGIVTKLGVRYA